MNRLEEQRMRDLAYHSNNVWLARSQLKIFMDSRESYYHQFVLCDVARKPPTPRMLEGQVLHAAVLENKPLASMVIEYPEDCLAKNGAKKPEACKAFEDAHPGMFCVKPGEWFRLRQLMQALEKTDLWNMIQASEQREKEIHGIYKGRQIKCTPDFVVELDDQLVIYDLKFVEDPTPSTFLRGAKRLKYWLQDAHYSAILEQYTAKPVVFRFIACETSAPYRIDWYEYDDRSREIARTQWRVSMDDLIQCERTGNFEDNHHHTMSVDLWDVSPEMLELELEGFDDE